MCLNKQHNVRCNTILSSCIRNLTQVSVYSYKKRPRDCHRQCFCKHLRIYIEQCYTLGLGLGLGPCVASMILASQGKAGGKTTSWCSFLSPSNWRYGVLLAHLENIASYLKRQRRAWKTPRPIGKQPYSGKCKRKEKYGEFCLHLTAVFIQWHWFISHTAEYSVD